MRRKKRYVAFRILSECELNYDEIKREIKNSIVKIFGERGYADIHPKFIDNLWDQNKQIGVVRCWHKEVYKLVFAIGATKFSCNSTTKVLKVSGTIKKIKTSILNKI